MQHPQCQMEFHRHPCRGQCACVSLGMIGEGIVLRRHDECRGEPWSDGCIERQRPGVKVLFWLRRVERQCSVHVGTGQQRRIGVGPHGRQIGTPREQGTE